MSRKKEVIGNVSAVICVASMVGVLLSPSIPVTAIILVVGGGLSLIGLGLMNRA